MNVEPLQLHRVCFFKTTNDLSVKKKVTKRNPDNEVQKSL